ncbi:capZ-interacting protein isoform X2 [Hippocampus comes]|uniref:capZ-interacting protein isoform X2 n=1 Tax=Hippocampus comes TaxID=109280 RepID=UPI00094E0976|nr:PREDICTED: capZ-interacting protein-like isoform X2 [Hippocampus comes]
MESPFRRKPPCSLRFPIRNDDVQQSDTNASETLSTSPLQIRMKKSSAIIERLQANLTLSPTALLPSPKGPEVNRQPDSPVPAPPSAPFAAATTTSPSPTLQPIQLCLEEEEGEDQEEPVSFDSPPEGASLPSFHKTRARLSFKRRPPTRQHRRSAGEEAPGLFGGIPSPCELHSPQTNGDAILQCPDRVPRKEGKGDDDEEQQEDKDDEEEQRKRANNPQEEEEETLEEEMQPRQTDGGDPDDLH